MSHTMEEDFQHFLSYSGLREESPETIEKMRKAYFGAWEPKLRTCCCIPNQSRLDLGCRNLDTYQIWYGNGIEDYTESCDAHLEQMLDDHDVFRIVRIPLPEQNPSLCPYCGGTDYHHTVECYLGKEEAQV